MKKPTVIKMFAVLVAALPPVIVLLINFPVFIESADKTISASAIVVGIICSLIFRDATRKLFQTPSGFKTCIFLFVASYCAVSLGEQIMLISLTALIAGLCALPLNVWHANLTKPATQDEMLKGLENMLKDIKGGNNEQ